MPFASFRKNPLVLLHASLIAVLTLGVVIEARAEATTSGVNVVSIGGAVTEIVYALGQGHRLIARDSTSVYPPEAALLPDVGYMRALSPEGVLSLGPEMVIAEAGAGPAAAVEVLEKSSVPYVSVPETETPEGVLEKIRVVGAALGVPEAARLLAAEVAANMREALQAVAAHPTGQRRVLFVLSTQGGRIMAGGKDTAADAIIALAGGENVIQTFDGYKPVTEEAITAARPDVILMMDRRGNHASSNAELWALPALASTPAARNDAVVRIDGLLLLGFGPRTPQAITALHTALAGGS